MASNSETGKAILRRVRWLYFFFLLAAAAIILRIIYIQFGPEGDRLRERATEITFDRRTIPAQRGDILARDGRILATTIPEYEVRMDFAVINMHDSTFVRQADSLALCLSQFFGDRTKDQYKNLLVESFRNKDKNRYSRILPRKINYEEQQVVKEFPIFRLGRYRGGYIAEASARRFAPMGSLARKAVGAVISDTVARDGIESSYNEPLRGTYGSSLMQKISGTFWIPVPDESNTEPINGLDVVTTIDVDLQDVAETMLKMQLEKGAADWGTVILMEVATGEIHAMSNITRTGPETFVEDFNYAIRSRNEPGSTFKLATLMTLLEDAGMTINDIVDCTSDANRRAMIGRARVTDDHREGKLTLKRVFEVSSNIGFARSVWDKYENNPARFVDYVSDRLHFGKPTGIDLPAEIAPVIKHPSDRNMWDRTTMQLMAYGYAFEITPLQTLMFYNAVANNGMMMQPMMVREIRSYGETVESFPPVVIDSAICSPRTVRDVRECLEGVVDEGTGRFLKSPYYSAAAKTGTAQVVLPGGGYGVPGRRHYLASFVGYFPADNPKYTCIVAIKTRQQPGRTYYGASLAGPVFKAIADRVYASSIELHRTEYSPHEVPIPASDVKGGRTAEIERLASYLPVADYNYGSSSWWSAHTAATEGSADGFPLLYEFDQSHQESEYLSMIPAPDLLGMGLRDAVYRAETEGLTVTAHGRGRVTSQNPAPGTPMEHYGNIQLTLKL